MPRGRSRSQGRWGDGRRRLEGCTRSVGSEVSVRGLRRERIPKRALKKARVWAWNQDPRAHRQRAGTQRCQQRAECARSVCPYGAGLCAPEFCLPGFSRSRGAPAPDAGGWRPRPRRSLRSSRPSRLCKDKRPMAYERSYISSHPLSWIQTHKDVEKYTESQNHARTRAHTQNPKKL